MDAEIQFAAADSELKVYCIPRPTEGPSRKYADLINHFGNNEGYSRVERLLSKPPSSEGLSAGVITQLFRMIALPHKMLHKSYIETLSSSEVLTNAMQHFVNAPDQEFKKLSNEDIAEIGKNFGDLYKRIDQKDKMQEV